MRINIDYWWALRVKQRNDDILADAFFRCTISEVIRITKGYDSSTALGVPPVQMPWTMAPLCMHYRKPLYTHPSRPTHHSVYTRYIRIVRSLICALVWIPRLGGFKVRLVVCSAKLFLKNACTTMLLSCALSPKRQFLWVSWIKAHGIQGVQGAPHEQKPDCMHTILDMLSAEHSLPVDAEARGWLACCH